MTDPRSVTERSFERTQVSFNRKMRALIGVNLAALALILIAVFFAHSVNNGIRTYVHAEGLWAKGQKNAVIALLDSVTFNHPETDAKFDQYIQIPLGFREAREALIQPEPDRELAAQGFLKGGVDPREVPRAISFFIDFNRYPYFREAVEIWTRADQKIEEFIALAVNIRSMREDGVPLSQLTPVTNELHRVNAELTALEVEFSDILEDAARVISTALVLVLFLLCLLAILLSLLIGKSVIGSIKRSLRNERYAQEISKVAIEVAELSAIRYNLVTHELRANARAQTRFNIPEESILSWSELRQSVHPKDVNAFDALFAEDADEETVIEQQFRLILDGKIHHVFARARYIRNDLGQRVAFVAEQDVTDEVTRDNRLKVRQAQKELAASISGSGFWSYSLNTSLCRWDKAIYRIWGIPEDIKPGADLDQLWTASLHPEDRERVIADEEHLISSGEMGKTLSHRYRIVHPEKGERWIEASFYLTTDPETGDRMLSGISRDITETALREETLVDEKRWIELATASADLGLWSYSADKNKTVWNEQYHRMLGSEPGQFNGPDEHNRYWIKSLHSGDRDRVLSEDRALLHQGSDADHVEREYRVIRPDGTRVWLAETIQISRRANGEVSELAGVARNITDEKLQWQALNEAQRQMNLALDAAEISMLEIDLATNTAKLIGGKHPRLVEGEQFDIAEFMGRASFSPNDAEAILKTLQSDNAQVTYRATYAADSGQNWTHLHTGAAYERSGRRKRLVVRTDVTAMYQANLELKESAERQKEMFAVIGHELRTPVASISMVTDDQDLSDLKKLSLIKETSRHLLSVLEDLRTVVSPDRVNLAVNENTNPVELIKRTLSPLSGILREENIELRLQLPESQEQCFKLRAQAMRQLLTNLVKNAAIHSGGEHIWVTLDYINTLDGQTDCRLTVADDGSGIDSALLPRMFEAFTRGDSDKDGSGLGLYIADQLAKSMEGQIRYQTSRAGGAEFVVQFPLLPSTATLEPAAAIESESFIAGKRILFAEDDPTIRLLTEKVLTKAGAVVVPCENGRVALEAFKPGQFDLVLTDIMMPEMNGYQLTLALRSQGCQLPIIGVTAAVIGKETDELIKAGADACISKPIRLERLVDALDSPTGK